MGEIKTDETYLEREIKINNEHFTHYFFARDVARSRRSICNPTEMT